MSDHDRGQVDASAAEVYDSLFVPALFGGFAEPVARASGVGADDDVLDVACGTGALSRVVRGLTSGRVVGLDVNPAMLVVATRHGGEIEYVEGDAQQLGFDANEFDLVVCQFGLMFLPDPVGGLAEMGRVGRRGAVAVWDAIDRSDGYAALQELFDDELGPDAASSLDAPFAMGAPGELERLLEAAQIESPSVRSIAGSARFDSVDQWVTTEVRGWTLGASVTDDQLAALIGVARDRLARFSHPDGCSFGITAKVATWAQS